MIGTGDGGTGIGASKKTTFKKWLKSNDNENIEFLVMIEMDSPAHSDCNMNQNNFVGTDNTGKMLTVNQRRNVADSESNGSNVNNDYNGDRNRWNQYNDTDTNLSNINNVNKKKRKELIDLLGTSEMLLNCRNFEYQVGLDGFDPLAALPLSQPLHSSISFTSATVATTALDSDYSSNYDNIKNDITIGNNNTNKFSNHNSNNNFDLLSLDDDITDNNSTNNDIYERENKCNNSNLLFTPAITKLIESNDEKKIKSLPRIDVEYPIPWLENYLVHLKELFQEFTTAKKNAVELLHKNCVFRSSTAKKIMTLQALPLNLHMQVMSVRSSLQKVDMNEEIKLKTKKDTSIDLEIDTDSDIEVNPPVEGVLDAITCGCLSPHGLGFSTKKGLDAMEGSLLSTKMRIDDLKKKLESNISKFKLDTSSGNNSIDDIYNVTDNKIGRLESTNQSNLMKEVERKNSNRNLLDDKNDEMDFIDIDNNNLQEKLKLSQKVLHHNSFAYKIKEKIGIEVLEYENSILKICQRRVYAISQAISITVSALIMKLTLIAENHIPPEVGEMWLLYGFLIVFEGLLSVSGNEKYMLEDTVTAVESLSTYQIKILPSSCNTKKKKNNCIDKDNFNLNDIIRFEADGIDDNINNQFNNNSIEDLNANNSTYANNSDKEKIEVNMNGREILIYFPAAALNSLPIEYQKGAHNGGAILRIVAVLFSQVSSAKCTMLCYLLLPSALRTDDDFTCHFLYFHPSIHLTSKVSFNPYYCVNSSIMTQRA